MKQNEKYKKQDLENLIFNEKLSYRKIGEIYGVSDSYIKKISRQLGIELTIRSKFPDNWIPANKGQGIKKICVNCGNEILSTYNKAKYCSSECSSDHRMKENYQYYLNNQETYTSLNAMRFLKKFILDDQNNLCKICGIENVWNNKPLVFILDHIDGNASNNKRENLRLVCGNCDSQLDTYKSKNKNSARKQRYLLNYKNNTIE